MQVDIRYLDKSIAKKTIAVEKIFLIAVEKKLVLPIAVGKMPMDGEKKVG